MLRITTAFFALILFLSLLWLGGIWFTLFIMLVGLVAYAEFLQMNRIQLRSVATGISFALFIFWTLSPGLLRTDLFAFIFILLLTATIFSKKHTYMDVAIQVLGILYIGTAFKLLLQTRMKPDGLIVILFIMLMIWLTDSGAYYIGKYYGKKKLHPAISPNKTVAGAFGGVGFAIIGAIIFYFIFRDRFYFMDLLPMAVVISIAGQVGDLIESAIKRKAGVKDSGNILPGHGGILDRFDGLLMVIPVLYLLHWI
jgi:phosphatidate cytidylyltransferase